MRGSPYLLTTDYLPRPPRDREMMERDTAAAFDALAAIPNLFLCMAPGLPAAGFLNAAFAASAAAFASRFALRSALTLSAACSASVGSTSAFGFASGFLAMVSSRVVVDECRASLLAPD
jgi:hypothetical protein